MVNFSAAHPSSTPIRVGLALSVLCASLVASAPATASPPELTAPTDYGTQDGIPVEEDPEGQLDGEAQIELPEWMLDRDPEAVGRLFALSEDELTALLERADTGYDSLDPADKAVVDLFVEQMQREFEDGLSYRTGDVDIQDGLARLHLDSNYRFLGPADSRKVLVEGWGNPPSSATGVLGMIVPADMMTLEQGSWAVILTWSADGYVDDDDAEDLDYDELLEALKDSSKAENEERRAGGYPTMDLRGWAEPPHYDEDKHALYWALRYESEGAPDDTLNFAIRVLGRRGVLQLNGVAGMSQLRQVKPAMEKIYTMVEFNPGHRYTDFDPDLDEIAAYGIGGLILGKVALKTGLFAGLFAGLLKILVAGKKLLIVGAIGVAAFFRRLVGRKEDDESSES